MVINSLEANIQKEKETDGKTPESNQRIDCWMLEQEKVAEETAQKLSVPINNYNRSLCAYNKMQKKLFGDMNEIDLFYASKRLKEGVPVLIVHYNEDGLIDALLCGTDKEFKDFFFEYGTNFENNFKCYYFREVK